MTAAALQLLNNPAFRQELLAQVSQEVAELETELKDLTRSRSELVQKVLHHTLEAGGKRLRPAFTILAGRAVNPEADSDRLRTLGATMEMIHMATLIHDDVIDNAPTRRGRPTASSEFGNTASIMSGDVLLAKAMSTLAIDGDLRLMQIVSSAVVDMAEGQVFELEARGEFDLSIDRHLEILQMKTASFIRCCCELGATATDGNRTQIEALASYGKHVGMAFQIADDLLDYRGDKRKTGKVVAGDFREGQATLPLIFLVETLSEAETQIARKKFGGFVTDDEIRMICDWMDTRGAFERCEKLAVQHIQSAHAALENLPDTEARAMLAAIADYVLLRQN